MERKGTERLFRDRKSSENYDGRASPRKVSRRKIPAILMPPERPRH